MLLAEYDRLLAEAKEERDLDIATVELILSLLESSVRHPVCETEESEKAEFFRDNKNLIYYFLKKNGIRVGPKGSERQKNYDDAFSAGKTGLFYAFDHFAPDEDLNPEERQKKRSVFLSKCIDGEIKNWLDKAVKKGFTIGKGFGIEAKADDLKIGSLASLNKTMKDKDGSDTDSSMQDFVADKNADIPGDERREDAMRKKFKQYISDMKDPTDKRLLTMLYSQAFDGDTNKADVAKELGMTAQSVDARLQRMRPAFVKILNDLKESKIDPLELYVKENARIMEGRSIPVGADGKIKHERAWGLTVGEFLDDFWRFSAPTMKRAIERDMDFGKMDFDQAFEKAMSSQNPIAQGLEVRCLPAKYLKQIKARLQSADEEY